MLLITPGTILKKSIIHNSLGNHIHTSTFTGPPMPVSHQPHCKKILPYFHSKSTLFPFKTIRPCAVTSGPDKKSIFLICLWCWLKSLSACPLLPLPLQPLDYFKETIIPLPATTVLLHRQDYVYPVLLTHQPKSHPDSDSYPFPGATLKIPGHDCHGKSVCLQAMKKVLLSCVFYMVCLPDFQK